MERNLFAVDVEVRLQPRRQRDLALRECACAEQLEQPSPVRPRGSGALFDWFAARGGKPVQENDCTIALVRADEQLTIEPGGQFELASRPVTDDQHFVDELSQYITQLAEASRELGLAWLCTGL